MQSGGGVPASAAGSGAGRLAAVRPDQAGKDRFRRRKAAELGASAVWPVITRHTDVARVNTDRLRANAIEAAEQCERLTVPEIREPVRLDQAMAGWDPARPLLLCAEAGPVRPVEAALAGLPPGPAAILTGPEGASPRMSLTG